MMAGERAIAVHCPGKEEGAMMGYVKGGRVSLDICRVRGRNPSC